MKFRNINPVGDVVVPELGGITVEYNHEVEATGDVAESFLKQKDNWRRVDKPESSKSAGEDKD